MVDELEMPVESWNNKFGYVWKNYLKLAKLRIKTKNVGTLIEFYNKNKLDLKMLSPQFFFWPSAYRLGSVKGDR
jgi:hypothetical protein